MKIFIIINNINDFIFQSLKYWIYEQSTKWMIQFNKNYNSEIVLIITINNYSKMANFSSAMLNYINKQTKQNYNLSTLFKIKKEIKTDDQLIGFLQNYFNEIEHIELKGYSMKYLLNILNTPKKDDKKSIQKKSLPKENKTKTEQRWKIW
jgi:hypothetical protein